MREMHGWLMNDMGSPFTKALAMFRHTSIGYFCLQNDVLRHVDASGAREERLADVNASDVLARLFQIATPHPERIWRKVLGVREARAA